VKTFSETTQFLMVQYVLNQTRRSSAGIPWQVGVTEHSVSYEVEILDHLEFRAFLYLGLGKKKQKFMN
jgi:hypothetical protein